MKIPAAIRAGDTARWGEQSFTGNLGELISSATHTLTFYVRGGAGQGATISGTPEGDGWVFAFTPELPPATYYWQAVAVETLTDERTTAGAGQLEVQPSLAYTGSPGAFDGRSQARKDLEAVEAAIRAIVSGGAVAEYTIGSRRLKKMELGDLLILRDRLRSDVIREERAAMIANGLGDPRKIHVRFTR